MKVNCIQNVASPVYATPQLQSEKINKSIKPFNSKDYRPFAYQTHPNMTFRGIDKSAEIAKKIAKAPLEDKINVAIQKLGPRRILVISKNIEEIQKQMMTLVNTLAFTLEHIYTITDSRIKETMGIIRDDEFEFKFINMGDEPIELIEGDNAIQPRTIMMATMGDAFVLGGSTCALYMEPDDASLKEYANEFITDFDYTDKSVETYKKHNTQIIQEMIPAKTEKKKGVTFADVGGQDKVIDVLFENIVFPIQNPDAFENFTTNKGVLLYGPPGTGKSLIAEALANEVNASYFKVAGTEFAAKYVGESEKNVRELIEKAIDAQPSIIFIDEVDALGRSRGGHDQYGDTLLNQFLKSMTDLKGHEVYCLAATNRLESLDEAFTRSGRFGEWIKVDAPDLDGTIQILDIHTKGKPIDDNLDKIELAKEMNSLKMTGADIAVTVADAHRNAYRRAGIFKAMRDKTYSPMMLNYFSITKEDFDKAIEEFKSKSKSDRKPIGFKQMK